jgi:hypothetical protein
MIATRSPGSTPASISAAVEALVAQLVPAQRPPTGSFDADLVRVRRGVTEPRHSVGEGVRDVPAGDRGADLGALGGYVRHAVS